MAPEPPKFLDKILENLAPPDSTRLPPKTGVPHEKLPPKTGIPAVMVPQRTVHPAPEPMPPSPERDTRPLNARIPEASPPPPQRGLPAASTPKRSLATIGLIAVTALNLTLVIIVVLLYRDRLSGEAQAHTARTTPQLVALPLVDQISDVPQQSVRTSPTTAVAESAERPRITGNIPPRNVGPGVLEIPKLVLCRGVTGFANYDPIPDAPLKPHHLPHIQAYVEIAHPKPEQRNDGRHIYYMTKSMKLYRSDIGPTEPVMDTALSLVVGGMSPRRDFFSAQPLQALRRVEPGEYTLLVRITDQISGESTSEETTFVIHAD